MLSCVQCGGLPSVFIKVKWVLEKVIHEDSTRFTVESLQDGMNKRKTASVYTPAPASVQVKSLGIIPNSGEKTVADTNLVEILQLLLQYDQDQEKNFSLFNVICKSWKTGKPSKALDEIDAMPQDGNISGKILKEIQDLQEHCCNHASFTFLSLEISQN